jgi:hypothetical protein
MGEQEPRWWCPGPCSVLRSSIRSPQDEMNGRRPGVKPGPSRVGAGAWRFVSEPFPAVRNRDLLIHGAKLRRPSRGDSVMQDRPCEPARVTAKPVPRLPRLPYTSAPEPLVGACHCPSATRKPTPTAPSASSDQCLNAGFEIGRARRRRRSGCASPWPSARSIAAASGAP